MNASTLLNSARKAGLFSCNSRLLQLCNRLNRHKENLVVNEIFFHIAMDTYEQVATAIKAITPLGRTGMPEDIALIAAFLASDEARWFTGEIIFGTGGLR
jgi:NAD(P)-dependent dehydrogenase (short-subunit alcohol dehydrogenase family)